MQVVVQLCTFHVHALSYTHLQFTYRPRVQKSSYCRKKDRTSECTGKYDHRKQFSSLGLRGLKEKCSYEPSHFTFSGRTVMMDIDEKEMIVRFRRKRIKRKLLKVSAKEIARRILCLVCGNCEGCITIHLSQTHHACLSMGKFKRLEYFDEALQRTLEATVMKTFTESLNAMDLSIYTEHPVKDWKSVFCTEHQEALKQEILIIL